MAEAIKLKRGMILDIDFDSTKGSETRIKTNVEIDLSENNGLTKNPLPIACKRA